jgi:ABC-2 type transport system ATP-binding protein
VGDTEPEATVALDGVTRSFGRLTAVSQLDLTLHPGRIYGLLGPNGAGKSTTTALILGLLSPDAGRVALFGRAPDDAARARVGYVPESRALPEKARVLETLVFFARMRGMSRSDAQRGALDWLERLDLSEKRDDAIGTLSNGQQQKVQIILAMMGRPDLLLLDEPLTALDPTHQGRVLEAFASAREAGCTVLIATHRLWEAEVFVDHVVLLDRGVKRLDAPLARALRDAGTNTWRIRTDDPAWIDGPGVLEVGPDSTSGDERGVRVRLVGPDAMQTVLARGFAAGAAILGFEEVLPSLTELYRSTIEAAG